MTAALDPPRVKPELSRLRTFNRGTRMNRPSSTITFATLAGLAVAFFWEMLDTFTEIEPSLGAVATSVALVGGVIGYWKKENVLPIAKSF